MPEQYLIREEGRHTHFTQVPNKVDDMGLAATTVRLYLHLKRVAGEYGRCFQSQDTLADHCSMGTRTVTRAKAELLKAGLITISVEIIAGRKCHVITIVDIWEENDAYFQMLAVSKDTAPMSDDIGHMPNNMPKKNPLRRTHKEDNSSALKNTQKLSPNPKIAEMQKHLGYPEPNFVCRLDAHGKDPIPNPAKEAMFIKKMEARGFDWDKDIWSQWCFKVTSRGGEFVSMQWVNEDIGKERGNGAHRGHNKEYSAAELSASLGKPLG